MPPRSFAPLIALACSALPAHAQQSERVAAPVPVAGTVFLDRNGNGSRDAGEPGVPGISISDQVTVIRSDQDGRFRFDAAGYGVVFVSLPTGYSSPGPLWRKVASDSVYSFPLVASSGDSTFTFLHASDTHIHQGNLARMQRFQAITDSVKPAFVLISGDLVRDALRVTEGEARGYYDLLSSHLRQFKVPVYTVPGNHEIFGIERHHSLVSRNHPLYGKKMYRSYLGPNYYSFNHGGVHFVGFDTVDYNDLWYNGHVDSLQLGWLKADLAALPAGTRVVTFNHIPLVTAAETIDGFREDGPAPSTIRIGKESFFRHVVRNTAAVLDVLGDRLEVALGGHMHRREKLEYETASGTRRFYQTAAVTDPERGIGPMAIRSGVTLYRVVNGRVDGGTFIPLN